MKCIKTLGLTIAILSSLTGCHWISYQVEVDQGNIISKQALSQLRAGMSKEQVKRVIGTPLLADMFHANRWDYVQYYKSGRTQKVQEGKVSLYFTNGLLSQIKADEIAEIKTEALPYGIFAD